MFTDILPETPACVTAILYVVDPALLFNTMLPDLASPVFGAIVPYIYCVPAFPIRVYIPLSDTPIWAAVASLGAMGELGTLERRMLTNATVPEDV